MNLKDLITRMLNERLAPSELAVIDESEQHRGHSGWREGGQTHFLIDIVSPAFIGKSRVERHRMVNDSVREAFDRGIHALAVKARAPGE